MIIKCNGKELELGKKTLIMGILNVTPDSFSDGGQFNEVELAVKRAKEMVEQGADIIDIGGESTRPGAPKITEKEEINRVIPILKAIREAVDVLISVDTYKASVAREALENGANIINDVWGFQKEPLIAKYIEEFDAIGIAMHNKQKSGNLETHNKRDFEYEEDIIESMLGFFNNTFAIAEKYNLDRNKIVLDPGIGFGKKTNQSLEVMARLKELKKLNQPLLLGTSRKSFIGDVLDSPSDDRLEGTLATNIIGVIYGYDIIRVHDVEEHSKALKMTDSIIRRK